LSFICVANIGLHAQSVSVKTDRSGILIGERISYDMLINLPADGYQVKVNFPDSISHFDVIENKNFDTVQNNGSFQVHKNIVFTSFDSGNWQIPSFKVLLKKNNTAFNLNTDSVLINVGYSAADSTNELRDIKPVMEVSVKDYFWYYITAAMLLLLIISGLIYWILKNREKVAVPVFHSALSPFDEAMKALNELKKQDVTKPVEIRLYHVTLAAIFKKYYSRKQSKDLMNNTTGDLLIAIREQWNEPAMFFPLAEALRCADAVKFAKYIPGISESARSFDQVKAVIEQIEKDLLPQKQ
jgi:hypothetical protein